MRGKIRRCINCGVRLKNVAGLPKRCARCGNLHQRRMAIRYHRKRGRRRERKRPFWVWAEDYLHYDAVIQR